MNKILLLFDVDGTLTLPRIKINDDMENTLRSVYNNPAIDIGFVGGSDLEKQKEQLGDAFMEEIFTWKFSENGLVSYKNKEFIHETSIIDYLGESKYQMLINTCLLVLSKTRLPVKRGHFIELRKGMINISPIGRSCSQSEREAFYELDKKDKIREKIIEEIQRELPPDLSLQFSIGGQISIDIFPPGWDKTYCLQFVEKKYSKICFFGDKTEKGGNDYEIYNDPRVLGFHVNNYQETIALLQKYIG